MKKLLLTLGVACMALPTFAGTRILYQQNFETASDVAATGWTYGGDKLSIASDEFGKFLELYQGNSNGRSGQVTWGQDIFMKDGVSLLENGTYKLKFDFCIAQGSDNQYNSAFTVFTNHKGVDNQPYRNPWSPAGWWQNYLFDMSQVDKEPLQFAIDGGTIETKNEETGEITYSIDYSDPTTFDARGWYTVILDVNVETREVEWSVESVTNGDIVKSGTRTVPETDVNGDPITMYAEGLWIMVARRNAIYDIDNIQVSCETEAGYANIPTIALTRLGKTADEELDLNMRAYTITFLEGETLNVTGTDGQTTEVDYAECDGAYVYETTKSGVLKAWTSCDGANSEVVEVEVDCAPVVLPAVTANISAVSEGYGKTYTLTVSNEEVPLRPNVFISYEFTGVNGEKVAMEDQASGCKVTVTEEGTLKVTSMAFGYESTTTSVQNDLKFETKKAYDFARMTKEEIKAAGFPDFTVLNSDQTSGFNNWTARKRLYYDVKGTQDVDADGNPAVDDKGNPIPMKAYPFGFIAADNTTNVIEYSVIDRSGIAETKEGEYFEGLTIFPDRGKVAEGGLPNVGMLYRIGLYNDQTTNTNNNIVVNGLDENDFVVFNYINNYGGNSNHPLVETDDEYYKVLAGEDAVYSVATAGELNEETNTYSVTYPLYRIDTACTKITIYKQAGGSAVEGIEATEVEGDDWYYSIDGVRMAQPTRPGIYIHKGKKILVK